MEAYVFNSIFEFVLVLVYLYIPSLSEMVWKYGFAYNSPLLILNSVFVFLLFCQFHFSSRFVNWFGGSIFVCYLCQCVSIVRSMIFEHPVRQIVLFIGGAGNPLVLLLMIALYAIVAMLLIVSMDKLFTPLWKILASFAARYDEKWSIKQLAN